MKMAGKIKNDPAQLFYEIVYWIESGSPRSAIARLKRWKKSVENTAYNKGRTARKDQTCDVCRKIIEDISKIEK